MKKKKPNKTKTGSSTEIELIFDDDRVTGVWYHSKLAPLLCTLCGKKCTDVRCVSVNPYCG